VLEDLPISFSLFDHGNGLGSAVRSLLGSASPEAHCVCVTDPQRASARDEIRGVSCRITDVRPSSWLGVLPPILHVCRPVNSRYPQ
jgi:hypothetical protein